MTPTAYLSYLHSAFGVVAVQDTATMSDIDDATMWAVEMWNPDDGRTVQRCLPDWCILGSHASGVHTDDDIAKRHSCAYVPPVPGAS